MDAILTFLLNKASFLYRNRGFRFIDSLVGQSSGGDAYLILESPQLRIRLVSDRAQLFLDFQSCVVKSKDWHPIDLVHKLITDQIRDSSELDDRYAAFLKDHFDDIADAFAKNNIKRTTERLAEFKKESARRRFG